MGAFRSVLVWFCCVAVLVAGTPSYGLVWCRTGDGKVALELAATDGRCDHVQAASELAPEQPGQSVHRTAAQCDDELVDAVSLSATPERVDAPAAALVFLPALGLSPAGHLTHGLKTRLRLPIATTTSTLDDASFVRETVVILV